ncbi:MAG: hypothetical protein Q7R98_03740 [Candidatus Jorgensenbacteria bacterium]|nr:hypothetical protein [Candidatus Jorgensenbacteria bacterium]
MSAGKLKLVYLTGYHACGKTELGNQLLRAIKAPIVETGAMVRADYTNRDFSFNNLDIADYVRKKEDEDPMYFTRLLKNRISKAITEVGKPIFVFVIGMRSLKNINDLKKIAPEWEHIIIWLNVKSREILRKRYNHKENKNLSQNEFSQLLIVDRSLGIEKLKIAADYIINNNEETTIDDLLQQGLAVLALPTQ